MPHLPDHQADHDPLLIAAFAAGDAEGADLERAQALVAGCDDCAALHHDLRSIAAALPAVPAPARSRDFRLSREQADALRPSGWRRLLTPLAGPRFAFAGPLGGSLAALGLVGILVAGAASSPIAGSGVAREQVAGTADGSAPVTTEVQPAAGSAAPAQPPQPAERPQPSAAAVAPDAGVVGDGGGAASTPPFDTNVQAPQPSDKAPVRAANEGSSAGAYEGMKSAPDASAPALVAPLAAPVAEASAMASPFLVGAMVLLVVGVLLAAGRLAARRVA